MRTWTAAALIMFGSCLELQSQSPVRPVDDGFPRYSVASVEAQYAGLWRQRTLHPYVCLIGRVALDSSAATYVEVDSLRVADEPWSTCNDPAVMGMVKMVDEIPTGTTAEAWGETMLGQLVAVALRQPNWRIIGVMFAVATVTLPDTTAITAGGDSLPRSLVPGFLWWPRTADNLRALDQLIPSNTDR
ncbi:MAG: hypothetical protein DMD60_03105 [Gemmatimonadetes bacterium]|nr:MAG: hypothetical protein DMD60_03105 [Gemmatimonadota bacterium]